jgi:ABC-type transporter Mla maintaining outer membrane lipid asymmetry ATPase subunit MlaF
MEPLPEGKYRNLHTNFLLLRDAKIIFEGNASELVYSQDEYIKEYLSQ